jgi:hypothetical protein
MRDPLKPNADGIFYDISEERELPKFVTKLRVSSQKQLKLLRLKVECIEDDFDAVAALGKARMSAKTLENLQTRRLFSGSSSQRGYTASLSPRNSLYTLRSRKSCFTSYMTYKL